MDFLYAIPAAVLLPLALVVAIGLACGGQILVHRWFDSRNFVSHNEVGGIIIAVSGTLYAVILGFLTVVAWEHFQEARELTVLESDADIDAWHTSVGLPPTLRQRIRADMARYADGMVQREWPLMRHGEFDKGAAMLSMDAIDAAGSYVPVNSGESNAQEATIAQLTVMHDARQRRITINRSGISWFEWLVLLTGAASITCFCWLFGIKNARTHLLMTSIVVTMIVSILVLLFELQYPFRSDIGVPPDAWREAVAHLHQMQAGPMVNMRM